MRRYTVTSQNHRIIGWKRTGGRVTGSRTAINVWNKLVQGEEAGMCGGDTRNQP